MTTVWPEMAHTGSVPRPQGTITQANKEILKLSLRARWAAECGCLHCKKTQPGSKLANYDRCISSPKLLSLNGSEKEMNKPARAHRLRTQT